MVNGNDDNGLNMIGIILCGIVGFITFGVALKVANFFIAPRDHWTKSGFAMLTTKLGMAVTASVYVVVILYMFLFS